MRYLQKKPNTVAFASIFLSSLFMGKSNARKQFDANDFLSHFPDSILVMEKDNVIFASEEIRRDIVLALALVFALSTGLKSAHIAMELGEEIEKIVENKAGADIPVVDDRSEYRRGQYISRADLENMAHVLVHDAIDCSVLARQINFEETK